MNNKSKFLIAIGALALLGVENSYAMRRTEESGGKRRVSRVRKVAVQQPVADPSAAVVKKADVETPRGRKRVVSKALPKKTQEETAIMCEKVALLSSPPTTTCLLEQAIEHGDSFSALAIIVGASFITDRIICHILTNKEKATHEERLQDIAKAEKILHFCRESLAIDKINDMLVRYLSADTEHLLSLLSKRDSGIQVEEILFEIKSQLEKRTTEIEEAKIRDSLLCISDSILSSSESKIIRHDSAIVERWIQEINSWCDNVLAQNNEVQLKVMKGYGFYEIFNLFKRQQIFAMDKAFASVARKLRVRKLLLSKPFSTLALLKQEQVSGSLEVADVEIYIGRLNRWCDDVLSQEGEDLRRIKEDREGVKRALEPFLTLKIPEITEAVKSIYKKIKAIQVDE